VVVHFRAHPLPGGRTRFGRVIEQLEIFASTMQIYHRAVIVGTKTSGIVRGSRFGPLPDGGKLQMSMQDFLTAQEKHLEGVGVTPDIIAEQTLDDLRAGRDPVIEAALAALRSAATTAASAR
jgi:carboxyl-terminal processing protease